MTPMIDTKNQYPNDAGFADTPETIQPLSLSITGKIPAYVQGSLYRTGPGRYNLDTKRNKAFSMAHWFDGFTLNHKFEIKNGAISYSSKYGCDDLMNHVIETGNMGDLFSFAQPRDPCESLFNKLSCVFKDSKPVMSPSMVNIGVTLSHSTNGKLTVRTDGNHVQTINAETLRPEAHSTYSPKIKGQISAAHGATDRKTGEYFNYILNLKDSKYTVFRELNGKTETLAVISSAKPSYIHSISLTSKYVILTVWQAYIPTMRDVVKVPWNGNLLAGINKKFDPSIPTQFYVIPRIGGRYKLYESPQAFFCFHTINAYEENDNIVLDLSYWNNHDVLTDLYVRYLTSASPEVKTAAKKSHSKFARFRLHKISDNSGRIDTAVRDEDFDVMADRDIELPTINPAYTTKKYRYTYGVHNRVSSLADSIIKIDLESKTCKIWSDYPEAYSTPGEPVFIPDPDSNDEDGGVLLTVVLDGVKRTSALVILDAKTLNVVARAQMTISVPFGFHGTFAACPGP